MKHVDVMVLGAGMVGIATALHLMERGRSVALVDRRGAAEETSFGNAGLIQAEAVMPYAFPLSLSRTLAVLAGRRTDARVSWSALPAVAPWLLAYARHGLAKAVERSARGNLPLVRHAISEHDRLAERADATHLLRRTGYTKVYRSPAALERAINADTALSERFGISFEAWDAARLRAEEPHVTEAAVGAVHLPEPVHLVDPGDLGKAYAALFEREGGIVARADAATLSRDGSGWQVNGDTPVRAGNAVIALGPWSGDLLKAHGVRVPLGIKRGYHRHYRPAGNTVMNRLLVDEANGIVMGPNKRGIRMTTGAEFARRDDPPTPVQVARAEPLARELFPLGEAEAGVPPWMGARPCLPDLLPMIGPVPGVDGLWANFGHQHLGLTLGPATGRLLAEMMTDNAPYTDPRPYRVDRFQGSWMGWLAPVR